MESELGIGSMVYVVNQDVLRVAQVVAKSKKRATVRWANSVRTCERKVSVVWTLFDWVCDPNKRVYPVAMHRDLEKCVGRKAAWRHNDALVRDALKVRWEANRSKGSAPETPAPTKAPNAPSICLYGMGVPGNGAGWLARWNGQGFGDGRPVIGRSYREAIADAFAVLRAAGATGYAVIFNADGDKCARFDLDLNVMRTPLVWTDAPQYELDVAELEKHAVSPEEDARVYGDRTPLDPPADLMVDTNAPLVKVTRALRVLVLDQRTRQWLQQHDPKALEQADRALAAADRAAGPTPLDVAR